MDRILLGDNLPLLQAEPGGSVQMAYLDPPFNTGRAQVRRTHAMHASADGDRNGFGGRRYASRLLAESSYRDHFEDYLAFLEPRLAEVHRLLAGTGTLYFHIDYREAHYCKLLLDEVFGRECFLNELIWAYDYGAKPRRRWPPKHDTILVYVKDPEAYYFDCDAVEREPYMAPGLVTAEKRARGKRPSSVWWHTIVSPTGREKTGYPTQKPEGIVRRMVQASSAPGDLCLDPFAGSGTLGAVAAALDRRYLLIDDNPEAVAVMRRRLGVTRAFGPGRVNLIGEHTDYNDGLALPFAIARGVTVTAEPLGGERFYARAEDLGEEDEFDLGEAARSEGWRAFVRGVVGELQAGGNEVHAARITITGDLPQGSGLSSSAALSTALCLALLGFEPSDRIALAKLCSRVENHWVGAQTGLLDQLAALCSQPGHAVRIDFRSLALEPVPLNLGDWTLVTLESGAEHEHAGGGYNARREECRAACEALGIASLRDAEDFDGLPEPLNRRVRHVVSENARVDAMTEALAAGDLEQAGALLDASHASLRDDYEVSVPEVEETVATLKRAGAAGARIVGGGFGGSVLALLPPGAPAPPEAFEVTPGASARLLPPRA